MKNWEETNAGYVEGFHVDLEYDGPRRSVILRAPGSNIQSMSVDVFQKWFQVISDNTSSVTCRALRKQGKISACYQQSRTKQYKSDTWIRFGPERNRECENP